MEKEIFQDIVLDHFRNPRWKVPLSEADDGVNTIRNPNCGDVVMLRVVKNHENVLMWEQNAQGCAASVASTSILCEHLNGLDRDASQRFVNLFQRALEAEDTELADELSEDIELQALLYFRNVPARKLCVSLAWSAAKNALAALCD